MLKHIDASVYTSLVDGALFFSDKIHDFLVINLIKKRW